MLPTSSTSPPPSTMTTTTGGASAAVEEICGCSLPLTDTLIQRQRDEKTVKTLRERLNAARHNHQALVNKYKDMSAHEQMLFNAVSSPHHIPVLLAFTPVVISHILFPPFSLDLSILRVPLADRGQQRAHRGPHQ